MRITPTIATATLASILASCTPIAEPRVTNAQAEAIGSGSYRLSWNASAKDAPVDIYVADRPNAPHDMLRLIADNDTDGRATVHHNSGDRPYFYVAPDGGNGIWTAERVLPLEGGRNFRDLGGYAAADGKRVRWGKVYRSGTMSGLTLADYDYLGNLGIRVVCDFRSSSERTAEPNKWASERQIDYWTRDYDAGFGQLGQLLSAKNITPDQVRSTMIEGYRKTPYEQAPAYREMFKRLVAGQIPLAFNCSAGKDRAGVAAALLLSALGVAREQIVTDYALSDKVVDFSKALTRKSDGANNFLAKLPREVLAPLMSSDPDYIRAMFAEIEQKHGSVDRYLKDVLELTDGDLRAIRASLLE